MNTDALAQQLVIDEGLRLRPYRDTVGKTTIGVGRNLDDVGISESEAMTLLGADIDRACADLDRALPWWRFMSDRRQQALCNACFNMGLGDSTHGLLSFRTALSRLQASDYEGAARAFLDSHWAQQVGGRAQRIAQMIREG